MCARPSRRRRRSATTGLQQESGRGAVVPDSFTHGSSAQRVQWLTTGLRSGTVQACNTFK